MLVGTAFLLRSYRAPGLLGLGRGIALRMAKKRAAPAAAAAEGGEAEAAGRKRGKAAAAGGKPPAAAAAVKKKEAPKGEEVPAATAAGERQYFLMKSEPDVFSIDDLDQKPNQTECWDGVRSHQAKKVMQGMRVGDLAFFYHSNAKPPGIVGIVEIVREAYPDHTQWDSKSDYYDASSLRDKPKWFMVDCKLVRKLQRQVTLEELKGHKEGALREMALFKYGRLSVQPVRPEEWAFVLGLEGQQQGGGEGAA